MKHKKSIIITSAILGVVILSSSILGVVLIQNNNDNNVGVLVDQHKIQYSVEAQNLNSMSDQKNSTSDSYVQINHSKSPINGVNHNWQSYYEIGITNKIYLDDSNSWLNPWLTYSYLENEAENSIMNFAKNFVINEFDFNYGIVGSDLSIDKLGNFSLGFLNDFTFIVDMTLNGTDETLGLTNQNLINVDDIISIDYSFSINKINSDLASNAPVGSDIRYFVENKTYAKQNKTTQEIGLYTLAEFQNWYRNVLINDMSSTFVDEVNLTNNDIIDSTTQKTLTETIQNAFDKSLNN